MSKIRRAILKFFLKDEIRLLPKALMLILFLFFSNITLAQIFPPDFLCVRSDTLFWDLPTNPCGSFNSYEVYFSATPNGPFNLLDDVNTQGQNFYHHPNPAGDTWYYYLQSDFNCPGEIPFQSDTLNNRQPEIAILKSASVNGNNIEVEWYPSPSPEVSAYVIFRNTSAGTIALDTIYGGTTYIDNNALPNSQAETYFVVALDECGNTSIFNDAHTTIYLTETVLGCDQKISLTWNAYEGWVNGIESQEVWMSLDGNTPTMIATLSASDTSYIFENANDSQNHCFYIKAKESVTGVEVFSNEICLIPDLVIPMRDLILKNVNVLLDNSVELTWSWNSDAEIQSIEILQNSNNAIPNTFTIIDSSPSPMPLGNGSSFVDNISAPNSGKIFYKIQTTDDCDTLAFSNYGSTIHLTGTPQQNLTNFLSWTDFDIENATVIDYSVYRIVNGTSTFLETVPSTTTTYSDIVDPENEEESNVCYYIVANAEVTLANGSTEIIESSSNLICVEQLTSIIAPNAFAPQGKNQIFKPFVIFGETVDYQLTIYNRWGELLFETKDQDQGWNGKYKGKVQPMGAYVFHVRVVQQSGRVVEDKGVLTLLR